MAAKRICFLGKGGIGKSLIAVNISAALRKQGYQVLQIGNDISLNSTLSLRGAADAIPALEEYRKKYVIDLKDYIIKTPSGVYCLELGSLEPGCGCMARSIHIIDEMLVNQKILETLKIDYIIYDISGDIPCTGYILPMRDGVMQKCIIVTDGRFSAFATANSILAGIVHASKDKIMPVSLLINYADRYPARAQLTEYAETIGLQEISSLEYYQKLEHSELAGQTIFSAYPDSRASKAIEALACQLIQIHADPMPKPLSRNDLLHWMQHWKKRYLAQQSGVIGVEDSSNI